MRTIKLLGLAVVLAAVSVPANAQGGRRFQRFAGLDELVRLEAREAGRFQMRRFALVRAQRMGQLRGQGMAQFRSQRMGQFRGLRRDGMAQLRAFKDGPRMGLRAGARAGLRAGSVAANATPGQKAFFEQFRGQRDAVKAKVKAGTLTREQARTQMKAWVTEHRPKK